MPAPVKTSLWDRVTSRAFTGINPEAARGILRMKFNRADIQRMHELSAKTKEGGLTRAERDELDFYLHVGHLLTLMHSKARVALKPTGVPKRRKSA